LAKIGGLHLAPPPPHHQRYRTCLLGRQLQPARSRHGEPNQFANDGAEPAIAEPFLHSGKNIFLSVSLGKDDAIGMQTRLSQGGKKQVGTRHAPEDRPPGARSDTCHEQRWRRAIYRSRPTAGELVNGAVGEASARKNGVNLRHSKA